MASQIIVKDWTLSPMRQVYPLSPVVYNLTGDFSQYSKAIQEVKGIQNGKKEVKLPLFTNDIMIFAKIWRNL